jgi:transaldolase
MPLETIDAFQDHGVVVPNTLVSGLDEARQLFVDLAAAGVNYDEVTATLEAEGVQKFSDSLHDLLASIDAKRGELAPAA